MKPSKHKPREVNKWEEIREIFDHYPDPQHQGHMQHKFLFQAQCVEDIESSLEQLTNTIRSSSEASDRLGRKVFWLNIVLGSLALIGTIFTVMTYFR